MRIVRLHQTVCLNLSITVMLIVCGSLADGMRASMFGLENRLARYIVYFGINRVQHSMENTFCAHVQ